MKAVISLMYQPDLSPDGRAVEQFLIEVPGGTDLDALASRLNVHASEWPGHDEYEWWVMVRGVEEISSDFDSIMDVLTDSAAGWADA